jgi:hypothetical protein
MSEVQGPDEGAQGTYLPQAAEMDVSAVRQNQDAEAKVEIGLPEHQRTVRSDEETLFRT